MTLSEREWTVLNVLWSTGGAELKEIVKQLYEKTKWSINTVHTYLTRMEAKGLVGINKDTKPHVYCALIDRESCRKRERTSFLRNVYSGSSSELIAAFIRDNHDSISPEEREKLRKILDEMEV